MKNVKHEIKHGGKMFVGSLTEPQATCVWNQVRSQIFDPLGVIVNSTQFEIRRHLRIQ